MGITKVHRILVLVGAALSAVVLFLALQFALQRVDATGNNGSSPLDSTLAPPGYLVGALNSPLQTPEPSPDIDEDPVDIESLTHTLYLPLISTPQNKFGTEVDSQFTNTVGADKIIQAGFGWYRHLQVSWASSEPVSGVYTMTPGGPTQWYQKLNDGLAHAVASGLGPIVADCELPPWLPQTQKRAPATLITDYFASSVVGAKDVTDPTNVTGWWDKQYAVLTQTSVLTVSWTYLFKSGIALWVFSPDQTCRYAKITVSHYASLSSAPITTTVLWLPTSVLMGLGEDFAYESVLPFHRYVVISVNWPVLVDAIYHPAGTNLEIRWMPVVMAE